jgi:hypothetical protein
MCWNVRIKLDRLKMVYCTTILFGSKRNLYDMIRLCFVGRKSVTMSQSVWQAFFFFFF